MEQWILYNPWVMDMKADGHRCPLSPLRVNTDFKARWILNIRMRADQSPCPLIMVMWCNPRCPGDQSLMSHCGPYWCSDWRSRESLCSAWLSVGPGLHCPPRPAYLTLTSPDVTRCQPCGSWALGAHSSHARLTTFQLPSSFVGLSSAEWLSYFAVHHDAKSFQWLQIGFNI